jgi:hypothetical protein
VYESRWSYVLSDGIVYIHHQLKDCVYFHECTFVTQLYRSPATCISFFSDAVCAVALWAVCLLWEQAMMWNCIQSVGLHCWIATVVMPLGPCRVAGSHVAWSAASDGPVVNNRHDILQWTDSSDIVDRVRPKTPCSVRHRATVLSTSFPRLFVSLCGGFPSHSNYHT